MRMTTVGALGALQRQRHVLDHQRQREVLADGLVLEQEARTGHSVVQLRPQTQVVQLRRQTQ
jgi:hypothetical protein